MTNFDKMEQNFVALTEEELMDVDGGFFGPVLFTIWGTKVLVGHALSAGVAVGFTALATN